MTPDELAALLSADDEVALLDVRDGPALWRDGTPLLASHLPLARLERHVETLVPRRETPVVVIGDGDSALAAVRVLRSRGYRDVATLRGGVAAWAASGRELYRSENAFARAFGAWVAERHHTPAIEASELAALIAAGEDVVVLDSRPPAELEDHAIPSARSAPGAELLDRGLELIGSPRTTVVVTCAARTRGILGTQALLNAGLPNRVRMLTGGTMGWWSARQPLVAGTRPQAPPRSGAHAADRAAAAAALRVRFDLPAPLTLAAWQRSTPAHDATTYLFDVRDPAERRAGHLPGSRPVPSWELVPKALAYAPVLRARIVLVDDEPGLRGLLTASWLLQMGWRDVRVLALTPADLARLPAARPDAGSSDADLADADAGADATDTAETAPPLPSYSPWRAADRAAAFGAYLGWERQACEQLARDATVPFRLL